MDPLREQWFLALFQELHQHIEQVAERLSAGTNYAAAPEIVDPVLPTPPPAPAPEPFPAPAPVPVPKAVSPSLPPEPAPVKKPRKAATSSSPAKSLEVPPEQIVQPDLSKLSLAEVAPLFNGIAKTIGREKALALIKEVTGATNLPAVRQDQYTDLYKVFKAAYHEACSPDADALPY